LNAKYNTIQVKFSIQMPFLFIGENFVVRRAKISITFLIFFNKIYFYRKPTFQAFYESRPVVKKSQGSIM
jgi:hypothetical protein